MCLLFIRPYTIAELGSLLLIGDLYGKAYIDNLYKWVPKLNPCVSCMSKLVSDVCFCESAGPEGGGGGVTIIEILKFPSQPFKNT